MNDRSTTDQTAPQGPSDVDTTRLGVAWRWVLRLRDDSVGQEDLAEWLLWYEADERNKEAFEDMQSFWRQAERVAEEPHALAPELWLGDLAQPRKAGQRVPGSGSVDARGRTVPVSRRRRTLGWVSAALAAGLCGVFILQTWKPAPVGTPQDNALSGSSAPANSDFPPRTVAENRLSDGSIVELAPKTQVEVLYTEKQRLLEMKGGAAYFQVAHNRERPFVVKVGGINVRAVGTAFNIRSGAGRVVVTVTEGTVDVYPTSDEGGSASDNGQTSHSVRVKAGNEVAWAQNAPGPVLSSVDPTYALSWREGRLDYLNEPISAAVADINRYSDHRVVVSDEAAGKILFSGTVLTKDTDSWVRALPSLFPIDLQTNVAGDIVLVSRGQAKRAQSTEEAAQR